MLIRGSLAPDGGIVKLAVADDRRLDFAGPAVVFDSPAQALEGVRAGQVQAGQVVVLRGQGPTGSPGMGMASQLVFAPDGAGLTGQVAVVTDAQLSGLVNKGIVGGEISPEAARGGPLALVRDGDLTRIDVPGRTAVSVWYRVCNVLNLAVGDFAMVGAARRRQRGAGQELLDAFAAGHAGRDGGQRAGRAANRLGRHPRVRARPGGATLMLPLIAVGYVSSAGFLGGSVGFLGGSVGAPLTGNLWPGSSTQSIAIGNGLITVALLAVAVFVASRILSSDIGLELYVLGVDVPTAAAMGVRTPRRRLELFVLGSVFAALGGAVYAGTQLFVPTTLVSPTAELALAQ